MADVDKSQLVDINGLETFLANTDERYVKVGEDQNTTYTFTQSGTTLTITGSDGSSATITLGGDITKDAIITALGYTPMDEASVVSESTVDSWFAE